MVLIGPLISTVRRPNRLYTADKVHILKQLTKKHGVDNLHYSPLSSLPESNVVKISHGTKRPILIKFSNCLYRSLSLARKGAKPPSRSSSKGGGLEAWLGVLTVSHQCGFVSS